MTRNILCIIDDQISFNVSGQSTLVDVSDLNKAENIERVFRIQFSKPPKKEYFESVLNVLKTNPQIVLRFYGNYSEDLIDWEALYFIEKLQIDLWETKKLEAIEKLVNLKELGISKNIKSSVSLNILRNLKKLEILYISISKDIEIIGTLTNLKFLSLREIKIKKLDFIESLQELEEVWISLGSYDDFNVICKLSKLKKLSLHQVRGIDDDTFTEIISKCKNLINLELQNLKNLTSLSFIRELTNLKYLRLDCVKNIETYSPVINLLNLETFSTTESRALDKKLFPLHKLKNVFLGDSYSKSEIEEFLHNFKGENLWIWGKEYRGNKNLKNPFTLNL